MSPYNALHSDGPRGARPAGERGRYAVKDGGMQRVDWMQRVSHSGTLTVLMLVTSSIVGCSGTPDKSQPRSAELAASIEVYGTEVGEQSSGEFDPDWGSEMDIANATGHPLQDVYISVSWIDSSGKEESGERRFVGKWDAEERVTFPRPFSGTSIQGPIVPEKITITVESGGKKIKFSLYELPGIKRTDMVVPKERRTV